MFQKSQQIIVSNSELTEDGDIPLAALFQKFHIWELIKQADKDAQDSNLQTSVTAIITETGFYKWRRDQQ